ncbi:T9SS type A sorting domain-containing protein [Hymenobacter cellulosilyticus]|uniref:T9SS type A sorting domain-containing protein n=1 Tax=Hymenobacter cellulosilyticus TaxID=2932248 RepID=A0A8T9Q6T7_9BACT|nr:T9SS type A sorting domain-containing protein [Hymenobacter cellulosilyticus]UOQ72121.1 T9SS type A sorting domain-containing protein [Hymenobacter cellulosilyticus]
MKQLFLTFALFLLASAATLAQTPTWSWLRTVEGVNSITDIACAPTGDFYLTGRFDNRLQLGNRVLTSPGPCLYIARLDASGQVQQVTQFNVSIDGLPNSLAVDRNGNCYLTGSFRGTLSHGRNTLLVSQTLDAADVLLLKTTPTGTVSWARQVSSTAPDRNTTPNQGWSVAVDASGNSFVTGTVSGATVRFGSLSFSNRQNRAFLASYSSQGAVRWAKVWDAPAGAYALSAGRATVVDGAGNCYVSGNFFNTLTIDGTTLQPANSDSNLFLLRFDAAQGQLRWALAPAGSGDGRSLGTDAAGKVYLADSFSGTTSFGTSTLTSTGSADIFVARYTPQGQAEWATALGGPNYDFPTDIAVDKAAGCAYLTGSQANGQAFITQLQATGQVARTTLVGGPGSSTGTSLILDGRNTVYTAGIATGSCQFGPYATSSPATAGYLARLESAGTRREVQPAPLVTSVFPNPAQGRFTLRIEAPVADEAFKATLLSPFGRVVAQQTLHTTAGNTDATFDTAGLPGGLYVLNLEHNQQVTTQLVNVR